jgi:Dyp-type peroxidase, C-terminal
VLDVRAAGFQPRFGYQGLETYVDAIVVGGPDVDDEGVEAGLEPGPVAPVPSPAIGEPAQAGTLLGGLFFIAFMKNPSQFVKLQTALAGDALNEYIPHTGSAVFACPPGLRPGRHWGDALFG